MPVKKGRPQAAALQSQAGQSGTEPARRRVPAALRLFLLFLSLSWILAPGWSCVRRVVPSNRSQTWTPGNAAQLLAATLAS